MNKVILVTVVYMAALVVPTSAMIINVPDDYTTIQEGIDASFDGDTVLVASGTYVENINFSGKNIVVGSWFLDAGDTSYISSTIIDSGASGSVVSFLNEEDNSAVITGFTIQNGLASHGGGIACDNSSPTISNNTISGNSAGSSGGGIDCWYSSPTINYNTIIGNSASDVGGGIYCGNSNPTINYNTIIGNSATGYGGGIYCGDSSPTISYNTITGNTASSHGGGIFCWVNSNPTISYNTITGNTASSHGGGIYCYNSSPVITNTIFWADSAPTGPEIYLIGTSSPVITYCDVQGGWAGEGNINSDPLFVDGDPFDFHLQINSPCIDAGDPDSPLDSDSSRADMGVYPFLHGIPDATEIISPDNGMVISHSSYLTWLKVPNPFYYDTVYYAVQIDDDSLFTGIDVEVDSISGYSTLLDESVSVLLGELDSSNVLQDNEKYFWRVNSKNRFGQESGFTESTNYFYYNSENNPPNPPVSGFSPANGEEIISLTPLITWNNAIDPDPDDDPGNLRYGLRLSLDLDFAGLVYYDTTEMGINQIQPESDLDDNSQYFYAVLTIDDEGLSSEWSETQNFWTNHYNYPPEPFTLYVPAPDINRVDYYTYFQWGNTVDYDPMASFDFTLQYSPDSTFAGLITSVEGLTDTTCTIRTDTLELAGQTLYWRVLAIDDDGLERIGGIPEPEVRGINILPAGDANGDGLLLGGDVTYLVGYFIGNNPAPDPPLAGDANGDCLLIGGDVTYLVGYFIGAVPRPVRGDCEEPVVMGISGD